jgi:hypothetical protein
MDQNVSLCAPPYTTGVVVSSELPIDLRTFVGRFHRDLGVFRLVCWFPGRYHSTSVSMGRAIDASFICKSSYFILKNVTIENKETKNAILLYPESLASYSTSLHSPPEPSSTLSCSLLLLKSSGSSGTARDCSIPLMGSNMEGRPFPIFCSILC